MRKNEAFNKKSLDVFKRTHSWRVLEEQFGMEEYVFISNLAFAFFTGKQGKFQLKIKPKASLCAVIRILFT